MIARTQKSEQRPILIPRPDLIFSKALLTSQILVGVNSTLLIENNNYAKVFAVTILNPETYIWIGAQGVAINNGFPISSGQTYTFGMLENTRLYAIAKIPLTIYILDLGLKMDNMN